MKALTETSAGSNASPQPWFHRFSRPLLFLITALALVGAFLAFTIPISVFPNTDFPRIIIGVDNGVAPIDQMLVTVTRPIEEAVNSVPGLQVSVPPPQPASSVAVNRSARLIAA